MAYVTGEDGNEEMKKGVNDGQYQLVLFTPTPHSCCHQLLSEVKREFVVDEAHCVAKMVNILFDIV